MRLGEALRASRYHFYFADGGRMAAIHQERRVMIWVDWDLSCAKITLWTDTTQEVFTDWQTVRLWLLCYRFLLPENTDWHPYPAHTEDAE